MYSYRFEFISKEKQMPFEVKSANANHIHEFVDGLLSIFVVIDNEGKYLINAQQTFSKEKKANLIRFIDKYKNSLPQINELLSFFKSINEDDEFFFLPNVQIGLLEKLKIKVYLEHKEDGDHEKQFEILTNLFNDLLRNYEIRAFGESRILIGERDRKNRVCRFCNKDNTNTTFKNKSHAISEALGNKTVISLEECDTCNKKFSETIELDIVEYFSLHRTVFGIKGKGGVKKFKGKNFNLSNEGQVNLNFYSLDDRPVIEYNDSTYNVTLHSNHLIKAQNLYKTLCKFFLSVVDKNELTNFKKTVDWINGFQGAKELPPVAQRVSYQSFSSQPSLKYYIRKNDDKSIPYAIGEFHFTCIILIFIIPFSSNDNKLFIDKKEFEAFWQTLKHLNTLEGWAFNDFSNNKPKKFSLNLNFEIQNKQ